MNEPAQRCEEQMPEVVGADVYGKTDNGHLGIVESPSVAVFHFSAADMFLGRRKTFHITVNTFGVIIMA